jgi:hypothetical protein
MAKKVLKKAQKQKQKQQKQTQNQKVIINVGSKARRQVKPKIHHHPSINQLLTDASTSHSQNLLNNLINQTTAFRSAEAQRTDVGNRLSYQVANPNQQFLKQFTTPRRNDDISTDIREEIANSDLPIQSKGYASLPTHLQRYMRMSPKRRVEANESDSDDDERTAEILRRRVIRRQEDIAESSRSTVQDSYRQVLPDNVANSANQMEEFQARIPAYHPVEPRQNDSGWGTSFSQTALPAEQGGGGTYERPINTFKIVMVDGEKRYIINGRAPVKQSTANQIYTVRQMREFDTDLQKKPKSTVGGGGAKSKKQSSIEDMFKKR